ncbi:Biopolymer transport protein ExbD/TolR [Roseivivax sp. THAF40]|uniref:biopolymer transporter ExbD n=1 Tax=unclassified Roseivivax TaxID=2639302 RepID=UPI00126980E8|nr:MULTISPECIES: biopolymer transporter ExbD [unclassified Roseivivax]QFS83640.1 Biopolymer transport protein ExbD/TolR [Roseivivax sp. THAF197b]QFT47448.1 Biopolymer transport protein ExbD/TolR [Roseivivax sp. THAF40]
MTRPRLAIRPRRRSREAVVPMINVVFLLLVFFLLTAQIAPVAPFEVTLPEAEAEETAQTAPLPLFVATDGRLSHGDLRGDAALAAAVAAGPVRLEADTRLPAQALAKLLARLTEAGAEEVITIATRAPSP